jgi:hypothetical protein
MSRANGANGGGIVRIGGRAAAVSMPLLVSLALLGQAVPSALAEEPLDRFGAVELNAGSSTITQTYGYDTTGFARQEGEGEFSSVECFENGRAGTAKSGKESAWVRFVASVSGTLTATLFTQSYFGMVDLWGGQPELGPETFKTLAPEHNCAFNRNKLQDEAKASEQVKPNVPIWVETAGAAQLAGTEECMPKCEFSLTSGKSTLTLQFTRADVDGDGIPDTLDVCKTEPGPSTTGGCPDRDNDGIRDQEDKCPAQPGPARFEGCPDRDNDGIPDRVDSCPDEGGPSRELVLGVTVNLDGCPDSDHDGTPNHRDKCPTVFADQSIAERGDGRAGCREPVKGHLEVRFEPQRKGALFTKIVLEGTAPGVEITVSCRGAACRHFRTIKRSATTPRVQLTRLLSRGRLRRGRAVWIPRGTTVTVKITHLGALGKIMKLTPRAGRRVKTERCLDLSDRPISCPG